MAQLTVYHQQKKHQIEVPEGSNLRSVLLQNNLSPYTKLTRKLNCGGNGVCATCGIIPVENVPKPLHWHDRLAAQFHYPRLSCQITIKGNMVIRLDDDKKVWGKPLNRR